VDDRVPASDEMSALETAGCDLVGAVVMGLPSRSVTLSRPDPL
jgi:hypothetical protein